MATLDVFAIFHCNLAYSSIEESQRRDVISRCYWPLLNLAATTPMPLAIEATGYTLEVIEALDPQWLHKLKALMDEGRVEFIGSGYAQLIGPLVPAQVNDANLRQGHAVYERLLGQRPTIALVNEQAYSSGLISHYLANGYQAIVMEWDNAAQQHPEWSRELRYFPQWAIDQRGRELALIWSQSISFQGLQRYAHGEMELADYLDLLRRHCGAERRTFCVYASDAEIFNFRPGRYATEPTQNEGIDEWERIGDLFRAFGASSMFVPIKPSEVLAIRKGENAWRRLSLETANWPVFVKKQHKYNLVRWAVTGRDDVNINSRCRRIYDAIKESDDAIQWKRLCYFWSSDFRTHITESRWANYLQELTEFENEVVAKPQLQVERTVGVNDRIAMERDGYFVKVTTSAMMLRLNCRRGLALQGLWIPQHEQPLIGTLQHGYYDEIDLAADWYSGHVVYERAGMHKVTDLEMIEPNCYYDGGCLCIESSIVTCIGRITKRYVINPDMAGFVLEYAFELTEPLSGAFRIGHITLNPSGWDWESLCYRVNNGGFEPETYMLSDSSVEQDALVSALVSARCGMGMTDGWLTVGDKDKEVKISVNALLSFPFAYVRHIETSQQYFTRASFSLSEMDDTRRPGLLQQTLKAGFLIEIG